MKTVITFTLFILTTKICYAQIDYTSLRQSEFYDICDDSIETKFDSVLIYDIRVNKKGKPKDSVFIAKQPIKTHYQEYDNHLYTFDNLGREFQRFDLKDGQKIINAEKQYNSDGKISLWVWYTKEGKVHSKTFYEYNEQGDLKRTNRYYGYWYLDKPKLEDRVEYTYSKNKLIEKKKYYDQKTDSVWFQVWTTKYDSLGRQIYYKDEVGAYYWFTTSLYDDNGRLTKEIIEGNEREKSIKEFSYQDNGLPYQLFWYYPDKKKKNFIRLTRFYYK